MGLLSLGGAPSFGKGCAIEVGLQAVLEILLYATGHASDSAQVCKRFRLPQVHGMDGHQEPQIAHAICLKHL